MDFCNYACVRICTTELGTELGTYLHKFAAASIGGVQLEYKVVQMVVVRILTNAEQQRSLPCILVLIDSRDV